MNQPPYNIRIKIQELTVSENKLIAVAEVLQEATRYRELAGERRKVDTSVLQRGDVDKNRRRLETHVR